MDMWQERTDMYLAGLEAEERKKQEQDDQTALEQKNRDDAKDQAEKILRADQTTNTFVGSVLNNILDNYDNPSYNLKLYMIGPGGEATSTNSQTGETERSTQGEDSDSGDARSDIPTPGAINNTGRGYLNDCVRDTPENTVVLAQTGVTEVGIDNLEITTVPGPNTTETSTVTFTITQPNAADFPDQIVKGRQFLGAPPDAGDCPLFLEINFVGYDESDVEADLNVEKTVGNFDVEKGGTPRNILGPLIFPLSLKNFTMNITGGGSVYNFTTVMQNDIAGADNFFRLQKAFTIHGSYIGEMLQHLQDQINEYNAKKTGEEAEKDDAHYKIDFGIQKFRIRRLHGLDIKDQRLDIQEAEKVSRVIGDQHKKGEAHKEAMMSSPFESASDFKKDQADNFAKKYNLPGSSDTKVNPVNPSDLTSEEIIEQYKSEFNILTPTKTTLEPDGTIKTEYNPIPKKNKVQVNPEADMKVSLHLDAGMGLDEVLGIILSMNTEFMQKASRTKDINDPTNKEVDTTKQVMWYTFDSYVKLGKFNESRKEYQKTAVFIPRTFVSDKSDIGIYQWEIEATNNLSRADATTRMRQMNVRKAYEYIFTGRNDQIKNIDITYNEGLSLLLPTDRGTLGDISLNAASILNSNPVPKNEELEDTGLEKLTKEKSKGGFFDQLKDLIKKGNNIAENIGRAANLSSEEIKDLVNNATGKAATKLQGILSDQTNAQAVADQLTKDRKTSPQSGSQTQTDEFTPSQSGFVYGGDLIGDNKYTEQLKNNVKTMGTPIRANFQAKDGSSNAGTFKGIKNNLFTYLYSQNIAVDFMNRLEMTIRGDPWWLGKKPQPPGDNKQIPGISADKSKSGPGDDLISSSNDNVNYLLFSLNSPRLFDPNVENEDKNTGMWMYEGDGTSYFMSGIYQVRDVVHRFNNGVYDCDITCVKEIAIDLSNVEREKGYMDPYTDTDRKGFTARLQDGTITESEAELHYDQDDVAYINGMLTSHTGKKFDEKFNMPAGLDEFQQKDWRVRQLLRLGKIDSEQYRAWHETTKTRFYKDQERRQKQDEENKKAQDELINMRFGG